MSVRLSRDCYLTNRDSKTVEIFTYDVFVVAIAFFAIFIANGAEPFVHETESLLAGFLLLYLQN